MKLEKDQLTTEINRSLFEIILNDETGLFDGIRREQVLKALLFVLYDEKVLTGPELEKLFLRIERVITTPTN